MKRAKTIAAGVACAALAALAGCGGEEKATATGRSMSAPAQATARQGNAAPQVTHLSIEPREPKPGMSVVARAEAKDPDGDAVHFEYLWSVDGQRVEGRGASLLVPEVPKGTPIEVEVVASDGRERSEPMHVRARVGNRPPVLTSVKLDPPDAVRIGKEVVAVPDAHDPDGDAIHFRYEWRVNGQPVRGDRERFATNGLHRGDHIEARVVASDGDEQSPPSDSPVVQVANTAPLITSTPPTSAGTDGSFRYAVEARDPDGDVNLRYRLGNAPAGAHIDPVMGEFTWKPTRDQVGTQTIEVVVEDGHGGETHQKFEVSVREVVANQGDEGASPQPKMVYGRARAAAQKKQQQQQDQEQEQAPAEPPAAPEQP
jgi:hypothetical protein